MNEKLRVAIIGCGAVAETYHLPVLAGHPAVQISVLVDRDENRARRLAQAYGVPHVLTDADQVTSDIADAVVISTPPIHHAPCAISMLGRGLHALVEKPIATNYEDACAIVRAADQNERVLSVGVFRRLLPSLRMLKQALDTEMLGKPLSARVGGGAVYGWEAETLANMEKDKAGGGVLMDMGPHFFDQLFYLFGDQATLKTYRDDSLGGVEADCEAEMTWTVNGAPVDVSVKLSRKRDLENEFCVVCERGEFVIPPGERYRVLVRPNEGTPLGVADASEQLGQLELVWKGDQPEPWLASFRDQFDDWLDAITSQTTPQLSGASALPVMKLIEQCYQARQSQQEPWIDHPFANKVDAVKCDDGKGSEKKSKTVGSTSDRTSISVTSPHRVLVTGASGFIGCRIAEILSRRDGYVVRAAVHSPSNASRVARLGVELQQADITREDEVRSLVADCDSVIHCAIGTESWDSASVRRVTVQGTRNMVDAVSKSGVRSFLHISSIAVHADDYKGIINEETPLNPERSVYSATKAAAEKAVTGSSLPWTVFRPGCVYGPYGKTFITRPIQSLAEGGLVLAGSEDSPSNTIYVDNLVEAAILAIENPENAGQSVFSIADDDEMTWGAFYGFFADRMHAKYRTTTGESAGTTERVRNQWIAAAADVARSQEVKSVAQKIIWTDPIGKLPRRFLDRSPGLKFRLKKILGLQAAAVYRADSGTSAVMPLEVLPRWAEVRSEKARRVLGWKPLLSRNECLQRTWDWLVHANLVTDSPRHECDA